ncbi:MAG: alpha/beta fold hydrolase, partial [Acidobacteriota bacterium]
EDAERAARLLSAGVDAFVDRWRALPLFATQDRLPDEERAAHDRRRRSHTADGLAWAIDTLSPGRMTDFRPSLARLDLPVDVLVGEDDARFLPLAHEITDQIPDGRLRIIAGAGHDVVLESPSAVAAAVTDTRRSRTDATRSLPTQGVA